MVYLRLASCTNGGHVFDCFCSSSASLSISILVNSYGTLSVWPHGLIVLSTEAVKSQKMNWSSVHALVLSMTRNLKSQKLGMVRNEAKIFVHVKGFWPHSHFGTGESRSLGMRLKLKWIW